MAGTVAKVTVAVAGDYTVDAVSWLAVAGALGASFLLALIPAIIARGKGRSFVGFWLFGVFFFLIALIVSLVITDGRRDVGPAGTACP